MTADSDLAYAVETSYLGGVGGTPTYVQPGKDPTVEDAELNNVLARLRDANDAVPLESVAQRLEGAFSVSFTLTNPPTWHELVFNDTDGSGNNVIRPGLMPSAEWYLGATFPTGGGAQATAERVLQGVAITDASVTYTEGGMVEVTLTAVYGDETYNESLTPGAVDRGTDSTPYHAASLDIDGVTQTTLQSATLSLSPLARLQRGSERSPLEAVVGAVEPELTAEVLIRGTDQLSLAYGSSGASAPQDQVGDVSGSLSFTVDGTPVTTYNFGSLTPATYNWSGLTDPETDLTEPIAFNVDEINATTP